MLIIVESYDNKSYDYLSVLRLYNFKGKNYIFTSGNSRFFHYYLINKKSKANYNPLSKSYNYLFDWHLWNNYIEKHKATMKHKISMLELHKNKQFITWKATLIQITKHLYITKAEVWMFTIRRSNLDQISCQYKII